MKRAAKAIQIQRFPEERAIRTRRTARARVMPSGEIDGQAAVCEKAVYAIRSSDIPFRGRARRHCRVALHQRGHSAAYLRIAELPGFPGPAGLIHRLDGAEKRQRKLAEARFPGVDENGLISLPPAWEGKVTAGRLACVAHTWAMSSLVREDPAAAKARKTAAARAMMIPFFTALILLGMLATGLLKFQIALAIGLACWAFFTFSALPTQFREWKAAEIAKSGLKEAGLWPLLPSDAMAVEQCLKALSWCNVAGFRRILPR